MAGRYTGSYLDQCSGWRAVATLADIGQASLVGRIPRDQIGLREKVGNWVCWYQPAKQCNENRDLQHQQRQQAPRQSSRLARTAKPDVVCLQRAEGDGLGIPRSRDRKGQATAPSGAAKSHGTALPFLRAVASPSSRTPRCPAILPNAEPLHRGGRQWRADRHALCAQRQPAARPKIRIQARVDGASARACGRALRASMRRSCWQGITMSCRPTRTFTRRNPTRTMRSCSRSLGRLFERLLDQGWVDAIRTLHPDAPMYTFWDYMRNRWPRDAGLRLDHLLLNRKAAKRLVEVGRRSRGPRLNERERSCSGLDHAARADRPGATEAGSNRIEAGADED